MKKYQGEFYLFLTALIWGSAMIFQKMGMDHIGPFLFGFFRFTIGALVLIPVIWIADRHRGKGNSLSGTTDGPCVEAGRDDGEGGMLQNGRQLPVRKNLLKDRTLLTGSLLCGLTQFAGGSFQQVGLVYTTAGKAGFITSLYIVIVPVMMLFMGRRLKLISWFGIGLAVVGLYLLSITEGFTMQLGDGLEIGAAIVYAVQLLLIDHYAGRTEPLRLAMLQFLVAGILSGLVALGFETWTVAAIAACMIPILYTGVLEVAAAYTLEILGQRTTAPHIAAIIMSLEALFAALCGALFLGEQMSGREVLGCALMMAAFLVVQLADILSPRGQPVNGPE